MLPPVLASSAAILLTAVVAPYTGLLIAALTATLRPPDGVPTPGLPILLAGAILLGWVYRLPIDRPRLRITLPLSQAGEALPAIPFGLIASVGCVGTQTVPMVRQIVRAPSATATEAELVSAVLSQAATQVASA